MKKTDKAKQEQKPQGRVLKGPKGVTELTDEELEQVQGGLTPGVYVIGSNAGGSGSGKVGQI